MSNTKVYLTRVIPESGMKRLKDYCDIEFWRDDAPVPREVLLEKVKGVDGILSMLSDPIDEDVMDAAGEQLRVISNYAVGYDNIDLDAAAARNIAVCNTPGVLTNATADLAFTLLMAASRRIIEGVDYVRDDKWITWGPKLLRGYDVWNSTLGIIGLGRIGAAMAVRARGFKMRVLYYNGGRRSEYETECGALMVESLDQLLTESDFVSIHCPLNSDTKGLIDSSALRKMKNSAVLINTARGPVIDTDALYDALENNEIAYAALDVTDPEPLRANHPLLKLPNCIVIPHLGSATLSTRDKMAEIAAENLIAVLEGREPQFRVK